MTKKKKTSWTTKETLERPTRDLAIPIREITIEEAITLGLRVGMCSWSGEDGEKIADIATSAGCGGTSIIFTYKDKIMFLNGPEVMRAWVAAFDPEGAKRLAG